MLDRVVANQRWTKSYNAIKVESLVSRCSDHRSLLATSGHLRVESLKRGRLFRYEAYWDIEYECSLKMAQLWRQPGQPIDPMKKVQYSLSTCQNELKQCSGRIHKGRQTRLNLKLEKLKEVYKKKFIA